MICNKLKKILYKNPYLRIIYRSNIKHLNRVIMNTFQQCEIKGRRILESFLQQVGATDLQPTEDEFAPVDYYFNLQQKKIVAEIKVRDIKYENYDTHLIEVSKYNSLVEAKQQQYLNIAYYINFFVDGDIINAYWYDTRDISQYGKRNSIYCNKTTSVYTGKTIKDLIMIPREKAHRFTFINNKWEKAL